MIQGFGVTYEGLKPPLYQLKKDFYRRFGVTYEGLKHRRRGIMVTVETCSFGVTYEGLKLPLTVTYLAADSSVLELPMRV